MFSNLLAVVGECSQGDQQKGQREKKRTRGCGVMRAEERLRGGPVPHLAPRPRLGLWLWAATTPVIKGILQM